MIKSVKKLSQKITCLVLSTILVFGTMVSVSYGMGPDIDPMQKIILEAMDLDKTARWNLADVLEDVTNSNYNDYVDDVSDIIPLNDQDITAALKSYANYSNTYKARISFMIESFKLSNIDTEAYAVFKFRRIQKMINFEITGDYFDDRGIKLFVSIFENLKLLTGKDSFSDDNSDAFKLDINVGSNDLKLELSKLIGSIKSLKDRGINSFDDFTTYIERVINSHANIEIYNFKLFLKNEGLGYSATPKKPANEDYNVTPIQKMYLELISLNRVDSALLLLDVLEMVEKGDLAAARVKAQDILGSMPSEDVNAALKAFASYSDDNKDMIKAAIRFIGLVIEDEDFETSGFTNIFERINFAFTGDYENDNGFVLFVKLLGTLRASSGEEFIFDSSRDQYKIDVNISKLKLLSTIEPKLDLVIKSMDTLTKRGINSFDDYVVELEATINAHSNEEIYNFKKFLDEERLGYGGKLPNPNPIEPTATPTVKPTSTTTSTTSPTASPTTSGTTTPTVTPTGTPTPTPTGTSSNGGNGGNNGGGSSNNNSSATPKPTTTPVVTEPAVTDAPGANPFVDLTDKHWANKNILELVEKKIITGYTDGTVKPDVQITRAEMAVIIAKAIGLEPAETPDLKFKDNSEIGSWAIGYIQVAVDKKIIVGYEDNTFRPSNKLTREEMVVMVMKAYLYEAVEAAELSFTDKKDIGSWSAGYIAKSAELGFVVGYPDNTFRPKKDVTRAEAATVITNCMNAKKEEKVAE